MLCTSCGTSLNTIERGYCNSCGGTERLGAERLRRQKQQIDLFNAFAENNVKLRFVPAGHLDRLAASLIDGFALSIIYYIIGIVMSVIVYFGMKHLAHSLWLEFLVTGGINIESLYYGAALSLSSLPAILIFSTLPPILYFAGFESSKLQATPGKLFMGLQTTDTFSEKLNFVHAIGRFFARYLFIIPLLVAWPLLFFPHIAIFLATCSILLAFATYAAILVDFEHRGLHDKLALTRVVQAFDINTTRKRLGYLIAFGPLCTYAAYLFLKYILA